MQIIRPKAFALYAAAGLAAAALVTFLYGLDIWAVRNPAYPAYEKLRYDNAEEIKKIDSVKAAREKAEITRPFQEVLLGDKPASTLGDTKVRDLALTLRGADRMLFSKELADLPRLMNYDCLHVAGNQAQGSAEITISKLWYSCATAEYELVRTEPYRIAGLVQGDRTALTASPDIPEPSAKLAAFNKLPVEPYRLPVQWTFGHYFRLWLAFSGAFALTYAIVGWRFAAEKDEHPLRAVPGFALGWLIILATLPGFLLTYGLWLFWLLLTGDVASAIKKMSAQRADALKLKLGRNILATLKAHVEVDGYRNKLVRVELEPENLRNALASNVLPESSKEEVEQYLSLCEESAAGHKPLMYV